MRVRGIELLFLEVNSLEESLDFYRSGLGFELEAHAPEAEPPMATLRAGGLRLMLAQVPLAMARRGRGRTQGRAALGRGLGWPLRHPRRPRPLPPLLRHLARRGRASRRRRARLVELSRQSLQCLQPFPCDGIAPRT